MFPSHCERKREKAFAIRMVTLLLDSTNAFRQGEQSFDKVIQKKDRLGKLTNDLYRIEKYVQS